MKLKEIAYSPAESQTYLGSPSIAQLPNGELLVSHDYFGPGAPHSPEGMEHLTSIYHSSNEGETWEHLTDIAGAFWSSLFVHHGTVYLLGTSQEYGSIVIRRSDDGGRTWTTPHDRHTGLLFPGGPGRTPPNYHCAPVPVLQADGRLYRAFEDCDPCEWGTGFRALVISAPEDANLLEASSWEMSNKLPYNPHWTPSHWPPLERPGWLEGNVVQDPNGQLWNILRFNSVPLVDKAAMLRIHDKGRLLSFDPQTGFIEFPGGMSKFTIRRDPLTGWYLTLCNPNTNPNWPRQRNTLALCGSQDLRHWQILHILIQDDSPLSPEESARLVGFQYPDWLFAGEDILYVVRTAYKGAHNYHDANRITFHRLCNFRRFLQPH